MGSWARKASEAGRDLANNANPYVERAAQMAERAKEASSAALGAAAARIQATPMWSGASRAVERARGSEAWQQLEAAAERAGSGARDAAVSAAGSVDKFRRDAQSLLGAIERASQEGASREEVIEAAAEAFDVVGGQFDLLADAVGVGAIGEAGVGLASVRGTELVFVPPDGPVRAQLRISRIVGQSARLAAGGHVGAYAAVYYGPREQLLRPLERRGADMGLVALSMGFFQARPERGEGRLAGWLFELSAGAGIGIPLLSDLSAFELEEVPLGTYSLSPAESERIEGAIARSPDRAQRRRVARLLTRDANSNPS